MKHLRLYENFKTEQEVADICEKYGITNWTINSEGLVDVKGNVSLQNKRLDKLPLKFGKVTGHFFCSNNNLTSLEGSPKYVGGDFDCYYNMLIYFEGSPDFISGNFDCYGNPIFSIWELFKDYSKIELFNYYDIVREFNGKPTIVLDRLNQFLEDIGKPPVKKVEGYINI